MKVRPDPVTDLLGAAREALQAELLPGLDGAARYCGLMIANALAMAEREIRLASSARARALADYAALYGAAEVSAAGRDEVERLQSLDRRMCADLRAGRFDSEAHERVARLLLERVVRELEVSHPAYLEKLREASGPPALR